MPVAEDTLSVALSSGNSHPLDVDVLPLPGQGKHAISDKLEGTYEWSSNPDNPRNWPSWKKWTAMIIVSFCTFVPPLASSMMAPGLPDIGSKYNITNPTVLSLTLSIFLLSYALGPLFFGPISEMYGRAWVLHISNLASLCFNLGCALSPNAGAFITFRFLCGFTGSASTVIGGGCISDLFVEKERAPVMALYTLGPIVGPVAGPIMGGFIAETIGVQYVFYLIAGLSGIAFIISIPLFRETYAPVIRRRLQAKGVDSEKGAPIPQKQDCLDYLWINLKRPIILLTRSFVLFVLSLYMALIYGIYYLMFATFPALYIDVYHFSVGTSGLAYIGLGLGFMLAAVFGARIANQIYLHLAARNQGQGKPEMRIPALMVGSLFAPVGLFWYGWSAQAKIHWIMPIIGTTIYGFSLTTSFLPIQLYIVDTFSYSASALAAAFMFRSLLAFVFPLFGEQMYAKLDYAGGNSLLAGLAIVFGIPFPIWIYYYGERIRARSSVNS